MQKLKRDSFDLKMNKRYPSTGLRNMGYTIETALAELADNAKDAKAKNIDIIFPSTLISALKGVLVIQDNGNGMSYEKLMDAIEVGSDRKYSDKDSGFYGVGMNAAIAHLGDSALIQTRLKSDDIITELEWDIKNSTPIQMSQRPAVAGDIACGTKIEITIGGQYVFYDKDSGKDSFVIKQLSARYCNTLSAGTMKIFFDDIPVAPSDPFYRDKIKKDKVKRAIARAVIEGTVDEIPITAYYVKDFAKNPSEFEDGSKNGFGLQHQGIFASYGGRFISLGGGYMGVSKRHASRTYLRIEIEIPRGLTQQFGVGANKNSIGIIANKTKAINVNLQKVVDIIHEFCKWGEGQYAKSDKHIGNTDTPAEKAKFKVKIVEGNITDKLWKAEKTSNGNAISINRNDTFFKKHVSSFTGDGLTRFHNAVAAIAEMEQYKETSDQKTIVKINAMLADLSKVILNMSAHK